MAVNRNTYQQVHTVSFNRQAIIDKIILNKELDKKDLRVFLLLLTTLDGFSYPPNIDPSKVKDPLNFKYVDIDWMSDTLDIKRKEVKRSIEQLEDEDIIEEGSSDTIKHGYRFTF